MEIRYYFQMLQRGWWIILLVMLMALTVSLGMSYVAIPQYEAKARFILAPSQQVLNSPDILRSLDTLDRTSVVSTYAEVMNSTRILNDAAALMGANPNDFGDYTILAVVLPSSSVLELTVTGPNPEATAAIANSIGYQTISYTKKLNQVYNLDFLDVAPVPEDSFSPQPVRDAGLSLALGAMAGIFLVIIGEQIRTPIEALRRRMIIDQPSSAYTRKYFERRLEEEQARTIKGDISLGLIELDGLNDLIETMPSGIAQQLLHEVARKLRNELRGNDIVGRWGSSTFSILLPSTPEVAAERTINRIRQALTEPIIIAKTQEAVHLFPFVAVKVSKNQEPTQEFINRTETALIQARQEYFAAESEENIK
jgi:diguanylate cyclase (GGDEF)-like protein